MPDQLQLDDAIYNPYAVEDLVETHPEAAEAFKVWFRAVGHFDEVPLLKLIAARGTEEIAKRRAAGEKSLAELPGLIHALNHLIEVLEDEVTQETNDASTKERLSKLAAAARHNRKEFEERAPTLVAKTLASVEGFPAALQQAAAIVARTAERLEALAASTNDGKKGFLQLRAMIEELRMIWAQLDAGLSGLPRAEARRLRDVQDRRMRDAAATICANLLTAKARARETGLLAAAEIEAKTSSPVDRFAAAIINANYQAANAVLAPWLQSVWTAETLRDKVEEEYKLASSAAGLQTAISPADYEAGSNPLGIAELRRLRAGSNQTIPEEVTEENFLGWVPLTILPDEEDSYLSSIDLLLTAYVIPVQMASEARIGFLAWGGEA